MPEFNLSLKPGLIKVNINYVLLATRKLLFRILKKFLCGYFLVLYVVSLNITLYCGTCTHRTKFEIRTLEFKEMWKICSLGVFGCLSCYLLHICSILRCHTHLHKYTYRHAHTYIHRYIQPSTSTHTYIQSDEHIIRYTRYK